MKRRWFLVGAAGVGLGLALATMGPAILLGAVMAVAGAGVLYSLSRCHHGGPLGLLPPTTSSDDGARTPARWYCDQCGQSWPIGLEHDRRPIVRFSGYDETKLPAAARRAAALYRQRQSIAVRRAGQSARRVSTPVPPSNVTSIAKRRVG
jgi:hypothetical protein